MDYLVNHPARLSSDDPYSRVRELLKKGESQQLKGPGLKKKIADIRKILEVSRIAAPVTLESDGLTDIVVYKVGKLGLFSKRKLYLYPRRYTAVVNCPGFRDKMREFTVTAGVSPEVILIHCEEVI